MRLPWLRRPGCAQQEQGPSFSLSPLSYFLFLHNVRTPTQRLPSSLLFIPASTPSWTFFLFAQCLSHSSSPASRFPHLLNSLQITGVRHYKGTRYCNHITFVCNVVMFTLLFRNSLITLQLLIKLLSCYLCHRSPSMICLVIICSNPLTSYDFGTIEQKN